ncbi:hypothetical protein QE370_000153 [Aeromicrobium sp. SORGH_AS981]|uniref:hypothetical protein n=1 Tax=Aeromicrobium sp. SORGH_AS_0981 TaxID=3041802 RepID=UPI002857533A|nr:hypothetical protein [Aeromicrobium sp. SORGH_AS_0981]MDR6116969.1 hypothetical protein [Aeromicrobium sp. SORGH_AS_0981]
MEVTRAHVSVVVVAAASAAAVWAIAGRAEGLGAVVTAVAVAAWTAWVIVGRPRRDARHAPADGATARRDDLSVDDCLNILFVAVVCQPFLRYVARAEAATDGALGVGTAVAVYLVWASYGRPRLKRRAAPEPAADS